MSISMLATARPAPPRRRARRSARSSTCPTTTCEGSPRQWPGGHGRRFFRNGPTREVLSMARAPQSTSQGQPETGSLALSEQVTYLAGPDDPVETTFMRHKFRANVPRDVSDPKLIEVGKRHRYFKAGAFDPARDVLVTDMTEPPKTAEAYRAWAIQWMKKLRALPTGDDVPLAERPIEMACQRWATEARMRAKLEVGFDDYKYISDFWQPVLAELMKREDDPRGIRDQIIRNGEFAELFLQVNRVGEAAGAEGGAAPTRHKPISCSRPSRIWACWRRATRLIRRTTRSCARTSIPPSARSRPSTSATSATPTTFRANCFCRSPT